MGSSMTPVGAVLRGLVAGAAGTTAMDLVWYRRYRRGGGEAGFYDWDTAVGLEGWDKASAPAQVGKRVAEGLLQRELPPTSARPVTNLVHWGTGILWGAAYGIVAGSLRRPRPLYGLVLGPVVWSSAYVVLPRTGIYKPLREYDARTLWEDASAHLVYGLAAATVFGALYRRP